MITYKITGIPRKIIQVLFLGAVMGELYIFSLLIQSKGQDYFLYVMVCMVSLIVKYLQGFLVYCIQIDVINKKIWLNRTFGEQLISFKDVKEWGYRNIVNETDSGHHQKNLEMYRNNGSKVLYPFSFAFKKPSNEVLQALIDCLGSTPKTYSMKIFTLQSDVLFVLL